jgi:hypothetical protein
MLEQILSNLELPKDLKILILIDNGIAEATIFILASFSLPLVSEMEWTESSQPKNSFL